MHVFSITKIQCNNKINCILKTKKLYKIHVHQLQSFIYEVISQISNNYSPVASA